MDIFVRKLCKVYGVKLCIEQTCAATIEETLDDHCRCVEAAVTANSTNDPFLEGISAISGEIRSYVHKRRGKKSFHQYAAMPRCTFSPYFLVPERGQAIPLRLVYLGTSPSGSGNESVGAAILDARHITERNVCKWTQQMFNTLHSIHKAYATLGHFEIDHVLLLPSDGGSRDGSRSSRSRGGSSKGGSSKGGGVFFTKDDDVNSLGGGSISTAGGSSVSSATELIWEDYGRHAWIDLLHRPSTSIVRSFAELKPFGNQFNCMLKFDMVSPEKVPEARAVFNSLVDCLHEDLRALGIVILQLLLRRVFSSPECKFWQTFRCTLFNHVNEDPSPKEAAAVSPGKKSPPKLTTLLDQLNFYIYRSGKSTGEVEKQFLRLLNEVEEALVGLLPTLSTWPEVMRRIVSVCFLPRLPIKDEGNKVSHVLAYPLWSVLAKLCKEAKELVMQHYEDSHYVKRSYWTEEDEQKRIRDKLILSKQLQAKAEAGALLAKQRVRKARYQVWWDMQSDAYRKRMEHQRRVRQEAERRRQESRRYIQAALFHFWPSSDMQRWIHLALSSYFHVVCLLHAYADSIRPRQPEVYVSRLLRDLDSLLDDLAVTRLCDKYSDARGRLHDAVYASFPHLLQFYPPPPVAGRVGGDAASEASQTAASSLAASLSSSSCFSFRRGGGRRAKRVVESSPSSPSSPSSSSSRQAGPRAGKAGASSWPPLLPGGSLAASQTPADLAVHLDATPTVDQILSPGGLDLPRVTLPPRTVQAMQLAAFHLAQQVGRCLDGHTVSRHLRAALQTPLRCDDQVSRHTFVFLSRQQVHFKRLAEQAAWLGAQTAAFLRPPVQAWYDDLHIVDRSRTRAMLVWMCAAWVQQYLWEAPLRARGEEAAAHLLVAFFRMLRVRRRWMAWSKASAEQRLGQSDVVWRKTLREGSAPGLGEGLGHKADRQGEGRTRTPGRRPLQLSPLPTREARSTAHHHHHHHHPVSADPPPRHVPLHMTIDRVESTRVTVRLVLSLPNSQAARPDSQASRPDSQAARPDSRPVPTASSSFASTSALDAPDVDNEDDAIVVLVAKAYLFGPQDAARVDGRASPPGRPLLCVYLQTPTRAAVFDPYTLVRHKFTDRFAPHCRPIDDCSLHAHLRLSTAADRSRAYRDRIWHLDLGSLSVHTAYDLVVELDADIVQHIGLRLAAWHRAGGSHMAEASSFSVVPQGLCVWPVYQPPVFCSQGAAFLAPQPVCTRGCLPGLPAYVHAHRQYQSELSPALCAELQSASGAEGRACAGYTWRYLLPGLGAVPEFSSLVQVYWPRSLEDDAQHTVYTVQRRLVLGVDEALYTAEREAAGLSPGAVSRLCTPQSGHTVVVAYKGPWGLVKDRVRPSAVPPPIQPGPAPVPRQCPASMDPTETHGDVHTVGVQDYVSTLLEDVDAVLRRQIHALVRRLYASLLSRGPRTAPDSSLDLVDSGVFVLLQYRVQVHNTYGSGPFSLTGLCKTADDGLDMAQHGLDRGLCEIAQVAVSTASLLARGKYPPLGHHHPVLDRFEGGPSIEDGGGRSIADIAPRPSSGIHAGQGEETSAVLSSSGDVVEHRGSTPTRPATSSRARTASRQRPVEEEQTEMQRWLRALSAASPMV